MSFSILEIVDLDDPLDVHLYPTIGADKDSIQLESSDGGDVKHFVTPEISVSSLVAHGSVANPDLITKTSLQSGARMNITASRVAFACGKFESAGGWVGLGVGGMAVAGAINAVSHMNAARRRGGKALVGQARFEWLAAVGWTSKGSGKGGSVRIFVDSPIVGDERLLLLDLVIPKKTAPDAIACVIIRRAAEFKLAAGISAPADEARLQQLITYEAPVLSSGQSALQWLRP